jgi:diguanylate cyclase (GGDEF)-like protein/PAS domain S-box-containing protein
LAAAILCALILGAAAIVGLRCRRELQAARRQRKEQRGELGALRLLESIANGSEAVIFAKDLQRRYTFANEATCRALGRPAAEVIGREAAAFFTSGDDQSIAKLDDEVLGTGQPFHGEVELTVAGAYRCFFATLGPLRDAEGAITGMFGVVHDITERKQQEERHRQWAKAFESTRDGVMITDAAGSIQSVNRAFSEITGYAPEQAIGRTPALLHSGRHDEAFYRELWQSLKAGGHWRGEIWNRRSNGEVYPEWLTVSEVRNEAGQVANYVGVFTDITRMKRDEAELQRLANFDPLTQLPNRRLLQLRLEQLLAHARRHGGRTAVLYIDLDGFKTVNDSLGHPAGDELLTCIAGRLRARVRAEDTLGRLGGDEFLVLVGSMADAEDAAVLAQDLLVAVARPVELSVGQEAYVTASIGISVYPDDGGETAADVLRDADAAMYRAKAEGRNRFVFYTQDLNAQAISKLETEASLSRALERSELLLHYQPKVDAASGRLVGAEALLRWQRNGELVPPGTFIPLAEHSSLILDIGAWVIDQTCRQIREWLDRGVAVPRIAVNVAARQFAAGDLHDVVSAALRRHRVEASLLELELTESMLIEKPQVGIAMLTRLKGIGVKLALDDFGTGYSSLGSLGRFPIDALKIDKSFVDQIADGTNGTAIVDTVIALAHRLDLVVVAEGVETEQQRSYLQQQGCDQLQGFCISRPLQAEAFEVLVRAQHSRETACER